MARTQAVCNYCNVVRTSIHNCDAIGFVEEPGTAFGELGAPQNAGSTAICCFGHTPLDSPTFFLCGPKGFTDNAHQVLSTLGVNPDRILEESFGESKLSTESRPLEAGPVGTVVFLHSEKVCQVGSGRAKRRADSVWLLLGKSQLPTPTQLQPSGRLSEDECTGLLSDI